ncbi:unnamed protein product [Brassica rapa subsp. narinosa]|uniref:(rape) hypothetical protein n=1 Tax=Brassica napus TaxID=3708 RepID=A0A816WWS0_BRANA|nr:unnamed protein product [Brassica napus]
MQRRNCRAPEMQRRSPRACSEMASRQVQDAAVGQQDALTENQVELPLAEKEEKKGRNREDIDPLDLILSTVEIVIHVIMR